MAEKNDESTAIIAVFACIGGAALFVAAIIFAMGVFLALALTIFCIFAWDRPVTIRRYTLEPEEARRFIGRGIIGAFVVPGFVAFCSLLFDARIDWSYWPHFVLTGYAGGSLGIAILLAIAEDERNKVMHSPPPQTPATPQKLLPPKTPEPFRYASWDDEE